LFFPKATQINHPNNHYQAKYTQLITPATTYLLSLPMIQRPKFAANTIFLSLTQDPMAKLLRIRSLSLPSTPRAHKATPHAPGRTRGLLDPPGRFPHRHRPASSRTRVPQFQPRYAARRRPGVSIAPHARASPAVPPLRTLRPPSCLRTPREPRPPVREGARPRFSSGAAAAGA
jgi:hypothetical protein